jgi:hypothetical protein
MYWIKQLFDIDAVGIDIDPSKVSKCKERGSMCLIGDFTAPNVPNDCFSVVSMLHVLEHLPSRELGIAAVTSSVNIASEMVLFRGPLWNTRRFDGTGLGIYFSNWSGHKSKFDLSDLLVGIDRSSKMANITMKAYVNGPIDSSDSRKILPMNKKTRDCHFYSPEMGPKPTIEYNPPVYTELVAVIHMRKDPHAIATKLDKYIEGYLAKKKGGVLIGEWTAAHGMVYTGDFHQAMLE